MVRTLLIDNYDSFTHNLADLLAGVNGVPPTVVTNDVSWDSLDFADFDNVVISPGPGDPTVPGDFGICARVIAESGLPVLGVCLGHQGLCASMGARVVPAPLPMHGRVSPIHHAGRDLFAGLPSPLSVVRYHSLIAVDLPDELEVLATTSEGLVMAVRHRSRPMWGVQFHPESIAAESGRAILENFRDLSAPAIAAPPPATRRAPAPLQRTGYVVEHRRIEHHPDPARLFRAAFAGRCGSFWLDGTAAPEAGSRFTLMGDCTGPLGEYVTYDVTTARVRIESAAGVDEHRVSSIFDYLEQQLRSRAVPRDPSLPFDFQLGYVGYLGYELKAETGGSSAYQSPYPDAALTFTDRAVVIDHDQRCTYLLTLSRSTNDPGDADWLDRVDAMVRYIGTAPAGAVDTELFQRGDIAPNLRHDAAAYRARIEASLDLIRAGETYEVCLTNAARVDCAIDPVDAFDRARALNPVPHAALLQFPGLAVVSASPERFLRIRGDRTAESKPIKGTRPRGATSEQDTRLREALLSSEKERAENLMIVDLVRNDLSRVCSPGTVHVPSLFGIESYASVHQMVFTVRGALRPDAHPVDAIRAMFPAGSMTAAPKLRTMEILDRLEEGPRGVYSGAIGYLSLAGTVDLSVVIRTMVATDTSVEFGVGGAITALSDPAEEYAEILVKAASSQRVIADVTRCAGRDDAAGAHTEPQLSPPLTASRT
ncbi:aminodeoxychorismate synthase component I [Aldersonia kunmingensis]|uniref:aminodeoxychorismate synthase component I n=1 Tax=Aldersonia kunmingensis TaxID=408066 RepID=UPI0008334BDA|nr:aminodeoxychorismate synthase component I [Aldersonia kunmingensis]